MPMMFEQQPRESEKAFAAFQVYLNLGLNRSLRTTAVRVGKSRQLLERWSRRFNWPARVQAHHAHLALIERKTAEKLAVQAGTDWAQRQEVHREDEWQARTELVQLAREAIARWMANTSRCGTLEGIARLLDLASKLGRVSSGLALEPSDKPAKDDAAFMIQIDVALDKIYGRTERPANVIEINPAPQLPQPAPNHDTV